jgi:ABC-2 type transport system permease protein
LVRKRIVNILKKEWEVMFNNLNGILFVTLLPLLIVGQGFLYLWLAARFGQEVILTSQMGQTAIQHLVKVLPAMAALPAEAQLKVLLLNQFSFFLLLIPTMIAISFATFSIVDEKLSHSLEALLATPVRTWELLLGKALSGSLPAIVITWLCSLVFLLGVVGLGWSHLIGLVVTPSWYISLFLLTPAVAVLSFMLGIIGSSRAADPRGAQSIALVVILPVFALIGVQVTGLVWFTPLLTLALALGIGVVDIFVLRVATHLFQRESIVIRWR